jgi:hypothetical protein
MKRFWPLWILGAAVVGLGLAMWWRWGTPVWLEQAIAWCM